MPRGAQHVRPDQGRLGRPADRLAHGLDPAQRDLRGWYAQTVELVQERIDGARAHEAARRARRAGRRPDRRIRVVPNGVDPVFTPDGPAAEGDYVLAVGTLEPRKNLAGVIEAARLAGVELRVAGAAGWGGVRCRGLGRRADDEELAASTAARAASSSRRSTRASGSPCSRRWPAGRRSSRAAAARRRRWPAARPCSSTRATLRRSRPGSTRPSAGGICSSRSGGRALDVHLAPFRRPGRGLWRELA